MFFFFLGSIFDGLRVASFFVVVRVYPARPCARLAMAWLFLDVFKRLLNCPRTGCDHLSFACSPFALVFALGGIYPKP